MKTCFYAICTMAALGLPSAAVAEQWNPDPAINMLVSGKDAVYQDLPLTAKGADGSSFVAWLSWEGETACLKIQHLDKEGNPLFGEEGIYISRNSTPSWSSGYGLTSDAEGNALVVYADKRNGVWQAYAYKVSPDGEMLWGDGVLIAGNATESCLNPKAIVTEKGNIVMAYQSLDGSRNSVKVTKLSADGSKLWGGLIEVTGTNGLYNLVPGLQDNFYISYFEADKGNLAVMRYNANGEQAWDEPAMLDQGAAVIGTEPLASSNGRGGIVVGWRHAPTQMTWDGRLQSVDEGGYMLWPEPLAFDNMPMPAADEQGNIFAAYSAGVTSSDNLFVNKYDVDGDCLWYTRGMIDYDTYMVSIYGVQPMGEDVAVVYRNAVDYNEASIEVLHLDEAGDPVVMQGKVSTLTGDKGAGGLCRPAEGELVLAWGDNGMSKGGGKIYAQNIKLDITAGIDSPEIDSRGLQAHYRDGIVFTGVAAGAVSLYTISGAQVWTGKSVGGEANCGLLPSGVYILMVGTESTKLIVI